MEILLQKPQLSTEHARSLQAESISAVNSCRFGPGFVRPAYESFCFSNLPGFFEKSLLGASIRPSLPNSVTGTLGRFDHLIFVFFDAFGWESFEQFRGVSPLLKRFDSDGLVMKSTSQFPSTTAAHVTTMMSGATAFQHEVCGWNYFEPRVGRMIRPLTFSFSGDKEAGTLAGGGFSPESVLPAGSFFQDLSSAGVHIELHGPVAFFPSPYGIRYAAPELFHGYRSIEEGVSKVVSSVRQSRKPSYHFLYADAYDVICHRLGVGASESNAIAKKLLQDFSSLSIGTFPPRTALVISADHGQMFDKPGQRIPVNRLIPDLAQYLKRDAVGQPIRFSGGRHHLFLHPEDSARDHLLAELRSKLAGVAEVMTLDELSAAGFLGPTPIAPSYAERLGSIGILPHAHHAVYWEEPPAFTFEESEPSTHGGATWHEMEVPLLVLPLGAA
jgi:hypothetical protein